MADAPDDSGECAPANPPKPAREQGDRFRTGDDPSQQRDEIHEAQRRVRQKKLKKKIESIEKSKQREENEFKTIRKREDLGLNETGDLGETTMFTADEDALFARAMQERDRGDCAKGAELIAELTLSHPSDSSLRYVLGYLYRGMGDMNAAVIAFRKAVELAPASERASLGLFHSLWDLDRQEAALSEVERFQSLTGSDTYAAIIRELLETSDI
jgi:predicted Zn-dependent protease